MCDERGRVSESIQKSVRWWGRAGGGEISTHETWVGLVSGRRLRPVLDLGAGCARRLQSLERMACGTYVKLVSGRRFRPVLDLGAGCARSVQSWERMAYGTYVRLVSGRRFRPVRDLGAGCARVQHVVRSRGRELFTRPRD